MMAGFKDKNLQILLFYYSLYLLSLSLIIWIFHLIFNLPPTSVPLKDVVWGIWGYGWDGWHYLSIATTGYSFPNQAFLPLYPLLIKALNFFLPLSISYRANLLLLPILLWFLLLLTKVMGISLQKKVTAVLVFLLFPMAFFLQANYSETLFILISLISLLLLIKRKFLLAAILCGLATATRINGLVLAVVIVLSFIVQNRHRGATFSIAIKTTLLGLICSLGLIFYFTYLHFTFGSYQVFFAAHKEWFRSPTSFLTTPVTIANSLVNALPRATSLVTDPPLSIFERKQAVRGVFEPLFVAFGLFLLILTFRKITWELYLFSLLNFLLPLSSGSTTSIGRCLLLMYPAILYFGSCLVGSIFLPVYVFVATLLQVIFVLLFVNNVFIA